MIEYVDYNKRGVKKATLKIKEIVKQKEEKNHNLQMAHRIGGVEAVNAFLLAGLNKNK